MDSLILQTITLVSTLPGSLAYYLILLFIFLFTSVMGFNQWRVGSIGGRPLLVAVILFGVRLALLVIEMTAAAGFLKPLLIIPPLDRAASALTLLLMLWAFAFPRSARLADAVFGLGGLGVVVALALSWAIWVQDVNAGLVTAYNGSLQELGWEIGQIVLLIIGLVVVGVRWKQAGLASLGVVGVLLVGHICQYSFYIPQTDAPGFVRLAELVALPLFATLVYTRAAPALVPRNFPAATPSGAPLPQAIEPRALLALAALNTAASLDELQQTIAVALAQAFRAELAFFILPPDRHGLAAVAACYHLRRGQQLARPELALKEYPALAYALSSGETSLLGFERNQVELLRLTAGTGLESISAALVAALGSSRGQALGVVVLVAASDHPAWTSDDQSLLAGLARSLAATYATVEQLTQLNQEIKGQALPASQPA